MAREKKSVHKVQMTDGKRNIIQQLLQEYDIQSAEDVQAEMQTQKNNDYYIEECQARLGGLTAKKQLWFWSHNLEF